MMLKGLKMYFLGDSITEGCGTSDISNVYWNLFAKYDGAIVNADGIGGTRIAAQYDYSPENPDNHYLTRIDKIPSDAQVIVIFGGTNDFDHGTATMGDINSRDDKTFYGALHNLYKAVLTAHPSATVIAVTPTHRFNEHDDRRNDGWRYIAPFYKYAEAIRDVAEYYSIPVLDLWKNSGFSCNVPEQMSIYMPDGLHPSDLGNERIYERLKGLVESL